MADMYHQIYEISSDGSFPEEDDAMSWVWRMIQMKLHLTQKKMSTSDVSTLISLALSAQAKLGNEYDCLCAFSNLTGYRPSSMSKSGLWMQMEVLISKLGGGPF